MKHGREPWAPAYSMVIGCSRGLGAAIVDELLRREGIVIGIARSRSEQIEKFPTWSSSGRYRHVELDIGNSDSVAILKKVAVQFARAPFVIIFNAACLLDEVKVDGTINHAVVEEVNRTGVYGFGNVLQAFENAFIQNGGALVAISSINAFVPPLLERRIAYPASKAYLHMAMRSLRFIWPKNVRLMTIHLGHVGEICKGRIFGLIKQPSYTDAAEMIVRCIWKRQSPIDITYPLIYRITYRGLLKIVPDIYYRTLLRTFLRFTRAI